MYTASDVAKFILSVCYYRDIPISNLKLQYLLYLTWIEFYKECKKFLFYDEFYALPAGPIVLNVFYDYCCYAGMPIHSKFECNNIIADDKHILNNILYRYINKSIFELNRRCKVNNSIWNKVYDNGNGKKKIISFDLLINMEAN